MSTERIPGPTLDELNRRFYEGCERHGVVPPVGPDGPPPQVTNEREVA